jgi:NADH:ubiquinone oxidoreductase subunit 4 (subunit M)
MSFYNQIFDRSFYRIMNGYDYSSSTTAVSDEFEQNYVVSEKINKIFFLFFIFSLQLILHILFITDNIIYFFIAFEASVLPVFGIIGFFGKRSLKFKAMTYLLYFTLASAVPLICVISYIYVNSGTFYYSGIKFFFFNSQFSDFTYKLLFIGFFIPFAVKLAMFPFHTWLPEAHVEASTEGSMILSGIMLKLGFFGIVRFCLSFFPSITMSVAPFILGFCFIGAISTSFSMYKQLDIKKIIAYSSVVHMNIAIFGYFCGSHTGIEGALLFSFSHGVSSAGLFCAVGFLHDKLKTRNLMEISGL